MEALPATAAVAGPSSDLSSSTNTAPAAAAYEDDLRHGGGHLLHHHHSHHHFALSAASQLPKPASSSMSPMSVTAASPEPAVKDMKNIGARLHDDCHEAELPSPRLRSSRLYKGKGKEAVAIEKPRKKPLRLLDLPLDILKDIIKEVTHTNDLTSLALCHSALHELTTPHIYSRFDIVWPDSSTQSDNRSGVDALTYGLATLVMAEEVFGEAPDQQQYAQNNRFSTSEGKPTDLTIRRRRGNHYAHFTKKFSLGNGPADWVQEYLITKEGGKMLGTLVALAVARMRSLETFIWDMPTGVLRDVWLALSSLGDRATVRSPCKLEKVWVRWHNNFLRPVDAAFVMPPPPPPINLHTMHTDGQYHVATAGPIPLTQMHPAALDRVEHPNFSVLPALKSLSVLDIDELTYLDEMAVLIGRSLDKLRELRVGIARHAMTKDWVTIWEGEQLRQVDRDYPTTGSLTIGEKRLGGVMGILTGFVCDMRKPRIVVPERRRHRRTSSRVSAPIPETPVTASAENPGLPQTAGIASPHDIAPASPVEVMSSASSPPQAAHAPETSILASEPEQSSDPAIEAALEAIAPMSEPLESPPVIQEAPTLDSLDDLQQPWLDNVLKLESLELERVPISVPVLQKAINWSTLTSLTLLHCGNHEQLWKTLRKQFAPTPKSPVYPSPRRVSGPSPKKGSKPTLPDAEMEYHLHLKKVHTNTVSPSLVSFLKETLAPNSLEVLFLQEARSYTSPVQVEAIYRGPLRRHRSSLKKLLIDSSEKGADGIPTNSNRWRRWILTRDILAFVCSGKMPALRELGMAIDYRDWHFFLQHLPSIPQLRSLYLPFLANHVSGPNVDPRELALQVVDIVALRSEVELCYMGIANKCFEILENRKDDVNKGDWQVSPTGFMDPDVVGSDGDEDDDDDDDAEEDEEVEELDEDLEEDTESDEDDIEDDTDSEADGAEFGRHAARLRLREILFYDDKVAIFKARHGRL